MNLLRLQLCFHLATASLHVESIFRGFDLIKTTEHVGPTAMLAKFAPRMQGLPAHVLWCMSSSITEHVGTFWMQPGQHGNTCLDSFEVCLLILTQTFATQRQRHAGVFVRRRRSQIRGTDAGPRKLYRNCPDGRCYEQSEPSTLGGSKPCS